MPELTHSSSRTESYGGFDQLFIAGRWRKGRSDRVNRDLNPWTGETLAQIPQATRDDLDEAYAAAKEAQPGWAAMLPRERAAVMRRAAAIMEARHQEIVWSLVHEAGSTSLKASLEWQAVSGVLGEAASRSYRLSSAEERVRGFEPEHKADLCAAHASVLRRAGSSARSVA